MNIEHYWVIKVRIKKGTSTAVILSEAKNLSCKVTSAGEILRFAQNDKLAVGIMEKAR